jgi:WD40 repeat protein/DNA-binding winged helix-turn-helix (wHTH) protein
MHNDLRLDVENTCLWSGSREIQLPPKAFAVLQYLLKHPGQIISKDVLLSAIWPNEEVTEAALTSIIRDLRHALEDNSKEPHYIETRHRLGYRWIGPELLLNPQPVQEAKGAQSRSQDWGESIDIHLFCGREQELATLAQWVVGERCRLVALLGLGGMGKSALSVKFAQQVAAEFDYLIWRSLRNAPPFVDLVRDLVKFFSNEQETKGDLSRLFQHLRTARCLIVLDNIETVLQNSTLVGQYRVGYEGYGELFQLMGETPHTSCLILTSREKPVEISLLEGNALAVKSLQLSGSLEASMALLQAKGLTGSPLLQQQLCQRYDCSPLAIKIVATSIKELFDGQIDRFLAEGVAIFGDIDQLLNQQFNRMSALEQTIAFWLAINRSLTTLAQLETQIVPRVSKLHLFSALESLSRRSFLEQRSGQYTLQPVVMEYITHRLIESVRNELMSECLPPHGSLLASHALVLTTLTSEIRESQMRLILAPIATYLQTTLLSPTTIRSCLQSILQQYKAANTPCPYGAGNIINLARHLSIDLAGWDFSTLSIWQANLQGTTLHGVNFGDCHFAHTVFTQIFAGVLTLAYSPDGSMLACGDAGGAVHLWQMVRGELLLTLKKHRGWIWSLAWSPDGRILATGGDDKTIKLWDVHSGEAIKTLSETNAVWSLAWSPDGQTLATGSFDKTVKLWDAVTGFCFKTLLGHDDLVAAVAWNPDGSRLASGSLDKTVKLWDVTTGECYQTLRQQEGGVRTVAWSPDGRILASGSADSSVNLWQIPAGKVLKTLKGHQKLVSSLAWSSDGAYLVSGGYDQQVILWEVCTGKPVKILPGHTSEVWAVACCPVNDRTFPIVASGSYDKTVKLWDIDRGECLNTLQGRTSGICSVAWSPDDRLLASGGEDNLIRLWDSQTGSCLKTLQGHAGGVWSVAWSTDGQVLASGSEDRTIKLWDCQTGKCLKTFSGYEDWVLSVAWCPINVSTHFNLADSPTPERELNQEVLSPEAAVEHNDWVLAGSSACRQIKLWDTRTGRQQHVLQEHSGFIWSVAWSPDGMILASGSADCQVKVWHRQTGCCLAALQGHTGFVWSVDWSADGQLLASGSDDRTITLWDMRTFQPINILQGHQDAVRAVAWHPLGSILASASHDGEIRIWDGAKGELLKRLPGHRDRVYALAWSRDGQTLASSSADETIALWDIETGSTQRILSAERPYQGTRIAAVTGLTAAQKSTLVALGAIGEAKDL